MATVGNGSRGATQRLHYIQWLRVFLVSLVVAHHAAQPYGPTGGEWPIDDPVSNPWIGPFFALNAAFFMGFFFLIAGYFTAGSYDRKGGGAFVRGRLIRLGVPLAFFTFCFMGPFSYLGTDRSQGFLAYFLFTYIGDWQILMGHLWFVAQLLTFSLLYALWRVLPFSNGTPWTVPAPREWHILAFTLALGFVGAGVRSVYPQDVWIWILWLVPAEPAHLPQYVSLFVVGLIAGRGKWFADIETAVGARWFVIGLAAFAFSRLGGPQMLSGLVDRQVLWGVLEAFVCVGLILGLLVGFRRYLSRPGRWLGRLDPNVYGVYLIHVIVVVGLQGAILEIALPAIVKAVIVTALGVPISFGLVALIRRIPGVARVI